MRLSTNRCWQEHAGSLPVNTDTDKDETAISAFPTNPEELTPEWVTQALRDSGSLVAGRVTRLRLDRGISPGFFGDIARVFLTYQNAKGLTPRSVVAKFPTAEAGAFRIGAERGYYEREVVFYREFALECGLRVPWCYASDFDPANNSSVLLLEDLSAYRPGTAASPSIADDDRAVMHQLGVFHALWWQSHELDHLDWLPPADAGADRFRRDFAAAWATLVDQLGEDLDSRAIARGEAVGDKVVDIKRDLAQGHSVILHADLRKENLFFIDADEPKVVAIDWQHCRRGRAPFDVATYLFGAMNEMTQEEESSLLGAYHQSLTQAGVDGYSLTDCRRDYELAMVDRFINVGSTLAAVQPESRGGQMALRYLAECGMANFIRHASVIETL